MGNGSTAVVEAKHVLPLLFLLPGRSARCSTGHRSPLPRCWALSVHKAEPGRERGGPRSHEHQPSRLHSAPRPPAPTTTTAVKCESSKAVAGYRTGHPVQRSLHLPIPCPELFYSIPVLSFTQDFSWLSFPPLWLSDGCSNNPTVSFSHCLPNWVNSLFLLYRWGNASRGQGTWSVIH